jgi:hypothetical protein
MENTFSQVKNYRKPGQKQGFYVIEPSGDTFIITKPEANTPPMSGKASL